MLKLKKITALRIFCFLFLFILVSRGFFELLFEKKLAFFIQVSAIILFLVLGFTVVGLKLKRQYFFKQLNLAILFVLSALGSAILTTLLDHGGAPFFYSGIMIFLLLSFVFVSSLNNLNVSIGLGNILIAIIIVLVAVAGYEQANSYLMPGAWWYSGKVRPASLTGSKQHYSIILAILSLYVYQYWLSTKKTKYLMGFLIGVAGVVFSLTRSGAMILGIAFFLYYSIVLYQKRIFRLNKKTIGFVIALFLGLVALLFYIDIQIFFERILSSVDTNSSGNSERVEAWALGWELLKSSNFVIGEYTGVITNATRTVTSTKSMVVESGTLQLILNFGVIGFIAFYGVLINIYRRIKKEHFFLFSVLGSCLLSTNVYQSIETIPFMLLLAFIPILSSDVRALSMGKAQ